MHSIKNPLAFSQTRSISILLGDHFTIQDDYLDCYGTAKIGTDIIEGKCTWNINIALENASPSQRALLDENYGRKDPEAEKKVKDIFREIDLPSKYSDYERETRGLTEKAIEDIDETCGEKGGSVILKKKIFWSFFDKMHGRNK